MLSEIKHEVSLGNVRESKHPSLPLSIFTYTTQCEIDENWNSITRKCRGLVVDEEGNIIISCLEKFFNSDTKFAAPIELKDPNTLITKKEDGYLIQIKNDSKYGLIITSKGSFDNKYIDKVKELIEGVEFPEGYTFICELLHDFPGDEGIIVTRHPETKLVCFAMKDSEGKEINISSLPKPLEKIKEFSLTDALLYLNEEVEGVVLKNKETNERVKLKTPWFFRMHKLISHCTKNAVWEALSKGDELDWDSMPDEFYDQMKTWETELVEAFEKEKQWMEEWEETIFEIQGMTKKALALNTSLGFSSYQKSLLFNYHDDHIQKAYDMIWKKLKPKDNDD